MKKLPRDLVLIRHGQSEGNLALERSKLGDDSLFTEELYAKDTRNWDLTEKGRMQAIAAGEWLRKHALCLFDQHFVSPYPRARQTAESLGLTDNWVQVNEIRERYKGDIENPFRPPHERNRLFKDEFDRREKLGIRWRPPNGESVLDVRERVLPFLERLKTEDAEHSVIAVCHIEVIQGIISYLEHMTEEEILHLTVLGTAETRPIGNCRILHYTRQDPFTGKITDEYEWMRSVCPMTEPAPDNWTIIERT